MIVVEEQHGLMSLPALELNQRQLRIASSALAHRILRELARKPTYAMELAKRLKEHEQKIYYHVRKLEKAGLIRVVQKQLVHGTQANIYAPSAPSYALLLQPLTKVHKIPGVTTRTEFLEPFIQNGRFNATIIVGSPDPHGPEMARSRDGYYGIDLALFLGTFLNSLTELTVRLDTEVRSEELENNIILIGGPVVNTITQQVNDKLPVRFDKNRAISSTITGNVYHDDSCGLIVKAKNPFNPKKQLLVIAGKRYAGTRAVMIAFLKHFDKLIQKNNGIHARIVEGRDKDADGIVDDAHFLE